MMSRQETQAFQSFEDWFGSHGDAEVESPGWWTDLDIFLHALAQARKKDSPASPRTSAEIAHHYANELYV